MCCSLIGWAFSGLLIGAIARFLWPGPVYMSWTMTMLVGIIGSLIGGVITHLVAGRPDQPYEPAGWLMSIVGAMVFLYFYGTSNRRKYGP